MSEHFQARLLPGDGIPALADKPAKATPRIALSAMMLAGSMSAWAQADTEQVMPTVQVTENRDNDSKESLRTTRSNIGKGNQDLGAPDLTVRNTLYPNTLDSIRTTIIEGRHGVMPAHRDLLGETRGRLVAAYVWSLSNARGTDAASGQQ